MIGIMDTKMIKRSVLLFVAGVCSVCVMAQEWKKQHEVSIGDFTELKVNDNINVVYSNNPDSLGKAQFMISNDKASAIIFSNNKKGVLTVQIAQEYESETKLPTVYVYSPYLQTIKNSSDSTVRVEKMSPCPEFKLITVGNGKIVAKEVNATKVVCEQRTGKGVIVVGGKCQSGQFKVLGSGEILADELSCANISCNILGTGTIGCNTQGILSVKGMGSGKVYYAGSPKEINTSQMGSIKVIPVE